MWKLPRVTVEFQNAVSRVELRKLTRGDAIDLFDRLERSAGRVLSVEAPGRAFWTVKQARRQFAAAVGEDHRRA